MSRSDLLQHFRIKIFNDEAHPHYFLGQSMRPRHSIILHINACASNDRELLSSNSVDIGVPGSIAKSRDLETFPTVDKEDEGL